MSNRVLVSLMLFSPVSQPTWIVAGALTAASGATASAVATGVAATLGSVTPISRRVPQPSSATSGASPLGALGALAVGASPITPAIPVTSLCAVA